MCFIMTPWAPDDICIRNVMKKLSISRDDAEKMVHDIDKHRREYYKYYTGLDWESAKNYDLCINSADYTADQITKLIRESAGLMAGL